jgi:2,5-diketo-D-gluconate reductase B
MVADPASCPVAGEMPMLGLGTWRNDDSRQCAESVRTALKAGYRHVDTAQAYGNEEAVGNGIAAADVPREEVFLATKVWLDSLGYDDVIETTEASLDRLGVEGVDLLYVHWPARTYAPEETLPAFDALRDRGAIDRVGVSNFTPDLIDRAQEALDAPIFANQIECHPLLDQADLRASCEARDIEVVAYSPLARGAVFDEPVLSEIAAEYDASEAAVSLAWLRTHGVTAIPKATSEAHIVDDWNSLRLDLDSEDIKRIDAIERTERQVDPKFAPW